MSGESQGESVDSRVYDAVRRRRVKELTELLKGGAPWTFRGPEGRSALGLAVSEGQVEMVRTLLDFGVNPNDHAIGEDAPLALAAGFGSGKLCKMLLDAGSDPNGESARGKSALLYAANGMESRDVERLIQKGADPNAAWGPNGWTPLHEACAAFWIDDEGPKVALALIAGGASVLAQANNGGELLTAAQVAEQKGNQEMASLLAPLERAERERQALEGSIPRTGLKEKTERWRCEKEGREADHEKPKDLKSRRGL